MSGRRVENTLKNESTVQDYIVPSFDSDVVDTTYIILPWIGSWQISNKLFDDAKIIKDLRGIRIIQQELINNNEGKKVYQISSHIKAPIGKTAIDLLIREPIAGHISWLVFPATGGAITREPNDLYTDNIKYRLHIPPVLTHPVLDRDEILDNIARGENESSIPRESIGLVNDALHIFKIYSPRTHEDRKTYNEATREGIQIFQKEYMEKNGRAFGAMGELCKETILAIDEALHAKWQRDLYFYIKLSEAPDRDERIYTVTDENYVNDEDIQRNIRNGVNIYGKEKYLSEKHLGKRVTYGTYKGIQHYATITTFPLDNDYDKICHAVIDVEGGGFDTVNTYDNAHLSIGLFQWNNSELYSLLIEFKNNYSSKFNDSIVKYDLDVANNKFIIDDIELEKGNAILLRKLKLVYCFIKVAEIEEFQTIQREAVAKRVKTVRNLTVKLIKAKDYITSEYGTALILDQHVNRPAHVSETIEKAANEVISLLQTQWEDGMLSNLSETNKTFFENCFDTNSHILKSSLSESDKTQLQSLVNDITNWGDYEESKILEKYLIIRPTIGVLKMTDSEGRAEKIEKHDLSKQRGSFNE